jgi:hypothetical protein
MTISESASGSESKCAFDPPGPHTPDASISSSQKDASLKSHFDVFDIERYYPFLRDEIKREDEITNQRMASSLTLQGFLITSMALVLTQASERWLLFEKLTMIAIGLIGLLAAVFSGLGVHASSESLKDAKRKWKKRFPKAERSCFPQAYGHGINFSLGSLYSYMLPIALIAMWVLYLVAGCRVGLWTGVIDACAHVGS